LDVRTIPLISRMPDRARSVAYAIGACIGTLVILGLLDGFLTPVHAFDFGGELKDGVNLPVAFSGALLLAASVMAVLCWRGAAGTGDPAWPWLAIACFLVFMGVDELLAIHEPLEPEVATSTASNLLFLLLAALGGGCWVAVLVTVWKLALPRLSWLAGGAAWSAAILMDEIHWASVGLGTLEEAGVLTGIEEVLELIGSSMFLLALLMVVEERRSGEMQAAPVAMRCAP
jgi:hypothetical protein